MTPVRARLMNPPNAVPDTGINMRNGRAEAPSRAKLVAAMKRQEEIRRAKEEIKRAEQQYWDMARKSAFTSAQFIMNEIAEELGIRLEEIIGPRRHARVTLYRHLAISIVWQLMPNLSTPKMGRMFRRDHSSIIHALRRMQPHIDAVAKTIGNDPSARRWTQEMREHLKLKYALLSRNALHEQGLNLGQVGAAKPASVFECKKDKHQQSEVH